MRKINNTNKYELLKDIVFKAGTIFKSVNFNDAQMDEPIESSIGITKDSSGDLIYYLDEGDKELKKWFKLIKE